MRGAAAGLTVLTLINLLNYLDRYIVYAVLPQVEREFGLTHEKAGLVGSAFMLVYMVAAPLAGFLGDRVQRRHVVALSVFLWSLATVASGLAASFIALLAARALIGIGEAGYGTAAPAVIADLFPRQRRTRVLAFFYTAIPVGAALGYLLGGFVSEHWAWRAAFFVGGAPGLALAFLMLFAPEPSRGASDAGEPAPQRVPLREGLRLVGGNAIFWFNTIGLTLMTFSIGGLSVWMPTFLELERGMSPSQTGFGLSAVTAAAGFAGTIAGGLLGDWAERRRAGGGMWISGLGLLLAAPFMIAAATTRSPALIFVWMFAAQALLFLNNGPINAAIVSCVSPALRAFTMGLNTLLIHLLGDAISPPVIGLIGRLSSLGRAIELNAIPVVIGGMVLVIGAAALGRRAAAPAPDPL